mmetsp:Transcript_16964/g.16194  ORF Transcript_16964/g.16194 Transcript_16964/m.16194 type:complete len:144 (+) Transcript_16964:998-1429(+)
MFVLGYLPTAENPTPPQIAAVPLVSTFTSIIVSIYFQKRIIKKFKNRLYPLATSVLILTIGSIPLLFLNDNPSVNWIIYVSSSIQGVGNAIMINTATSITSDIIGQSGETCSFVTSTYLSLFKLLDGILTYFLLEYITKFEST